MRPYFLVLLAMTVACGGDGGITNATTGSLEVQTATTGQVPSSAYTYRVDGEPAQPIGSNTTVDRPELESGSHIVELAGLPDGCSTSDNPQTISITAGATTTVTFAINCVPPVGTIQIITTTEGTSPGNYDLVVDGSPFGSIGATTTRSLEGIGSGAHSIGLSALPANCQIQVDNPQTTTVRTGGTVTVSFPISCTPPPLETGILSITTATTGVDPDGFRVVLDGGARQPIGMNGAVTLANVAAGSHSVRLTGLAEGCTISGSNPRRVTVTSGVTVPVAFTVTCAPPPTTGSIRVVTTTTGGAVDPDGYAFSVDGQTPQPVGATAAVTVADVAVGPHSIALSGIAETCALDGLNPRTVTVPAGAIVDVSFAIRCVSAATGQWSRMESGTTFSLYSVWGSSATDVFSVGEPGGRFESGIFHYNGQAWSQQSIEAGVTLYSVWGSGSSDVFAVGSSPLGERGHDGVLLHFDGSSWTTMQGPGVGTSDGTIEVNFNSVWGSSGTDVFAVGVVNSGHIGAIIAHYDGESWSPLPLPASDDRVLKDVFGTSSQDVYGVGYFDASNSLRRKGSMLARSRLFSAGLIVHYDGSQWTEVAPPGGNVAFAAVWASAPNDVFAVGSIDDLAMVYHFDGIAWTMMTVPPTGPLLDVWGVSGTDVYAAGVGTILHYDGQLWTEVQAGSQRLAGVWVNSATDVFAVGSGGTVLRGTASTSTIARP